MIAAFTNQVSGEPGAAHHASLGPVTLEHSGYATDGDLADPWSSASGVRAVIAESYAATAASEYPRLA